VFTISIVKALLLALALPVLALAESKLPREPGAIYLEDLALRPVKVATTVDATVTSRTVDGRYLGVIRKGSPVELVAVSDGLARVRGQAQQGGVIGWVDLRSITPLRAEFLDSLRQNAKRKVEVDALVAKGEVALNMTPDEVAASLGKVQKKTSKLDAGGRKDTWEFVRYARVPQETTGYDRFGRLVVSTVYIKVPAGKLTVNFENSLVTSIEQSEGNTDVQVAPRLVAAPIVVAF
jgi:hypothetical protein